MAQRDNLPRDVKDARQAITDSLQALVIEGVIINRDDVIQALTDGGFEIARETDKAISIKNSDPTAKRNIRLIGGLYERGFRFSPEVQSTVTEASEDYRARSRERYDAAKQLYNSEIIRKQNYHQARHGKPRHEQLRATLATYQTDMSTALDTYMSNVQAHTTQHLEQFAEDIEKTIEAYTQHIAYLIEQREDRIAKVIKSEMKKQAIVSGFIALMLLMLGMIMGALIINKFSKPAYINQQTQPQIQQSINYGQK